MNLSPVAGLRNAGPTDQLQNVKSPEEAAEAFESLMVQEFVKVMTKDLFKSNLSGECGPGWMQAQNDTQRSAMSDALTKHLVETDVFNFDELILQTWRNNATIGMESD